MKNIFSKYLVAVIFLSLLVYNPNAFATKKQYITTNSQNQRITLKGEVVDEDKNPIIGATVILKNNPSQGTITDYNGEFILQTTKGETLIVECIGFVGQEVVVDSENIVITLKNDILELDDIIVTGYQKIEKGRATGSYDIIDPKATQAIVSPNILNKLESTTSGLHIDPTGAMIIRGQSTLYSSTSPLIVVDGFPMEYATTNINPNDIEQITVLKDAASASIWGVRAANGVIVITTKKAKFDQKLSVSYNSNFKLRNATDLNTYGYMSGADQVDYERYAYSKGFRSGEFTGASSLSDLLDSYTQVGEVYFKESKGLITSEEANQRYDELASFDNHAFIEDYFYRMPLFQQHNIVLNSGGKISSTYLSLLYENNLLGMVGNDSDKVGFQLNNSINVSNFLKINFGLRGNVEHKNMYSGNPFSVPAYDRFLDEDGNYTNIYNSFSQATKDYYQNLHGFIDWSYNPLQDRELVDESDYNYNFAANVSFDFNLPFGIKFSTSGMYTIDNDEYTTYYYPESHYVRGLSNIFSNYNETTGVTKNYIPTGGVKDYTFGRGTSYTWRNILSYTKHFDKFLLNAQAGTEVFAKRSYSNYDRYYGYDPQGLVFDYGMDLNALIVEGVNTFHPAFGRQKLAYSPYHSEVDNRYFSTFATADFTYNNKYTAFGSIRMDKTNLYGQSAEYRNQPTWSIGGRWALSRESFFKVKHIDDFAIKGSYGLSGNINKDTSPYLIASPSLDYYTGLHMLSIGNPENPLLGWEKVYSTNIGVDVAMFDYRLNIGAEFYNKLTEDALGSVITDPTIGFGNVFMNSASIKNYGVDLNISGDIIRKKTILYNSTLNMSFNRNKVTKVNSGDVSTISILGNSPIVGQPIDYIWAFEYAGLDRSGDAQFYNAEGEIMSQSDYNSLTVEDLKIVGTASPKIYGGWMNNVSWNNFTLDFLISYQFGAKFRAPSNTSPYGFSSATKISEYYNNTWEKLGDENIPGIAPRVSFVDSNNQSQNIFLYSDQRVESADFIKLKAVGLTYNFKHLIKSKTLSDFNARVSVENVCNWFANSGGWDPESVTYRPTSGSSISYTGKIPMFYTLTINLTL